MDHINQTLYIPLYGKACVSRRGIILNDRKAEEIWDAEGFPLKGKSASKWLALYMGMRSAVFDRWLQARMAGLPGAVVLHIGCGLDSRIQRVGCRGHRWFDLDFPEVIAERKRYFQENKFYFMVAADVRDTAWLEKLPRGTAIIVMEGVSMYLTPEELRRTLANLGGHFRKIHLLMDCYTELAAKASRYKNPINDVGVTEVYGLDDPRGCIRGTGLCFHGEQDMTPAYLTGQLRGPEGMIFRTLYAGPVARKLYRLYEYCKD